MKDTRSLQTSASLPWHCIASRWVQSIWWPKKGPTIFGKLRPILRLSLSVSGFSHVFANGQFCNVSNVLVTRRRVKAPLWIISHGGEILSQATCTRQIWCRSLQGLLFGKHGMKNWSFAEAKWGRTAVLSALEAAFPIKMAAPTA